MDGDGEGGGSIIRVVSLKGSEDAGDIILAAELDLHGGSSGLGVLRVVRTEGLEDAGNIVLRSCSVLDMLLRKHLTLNIPAEAKTALEKAATVMKDV